MNTKTIKCVLYRSMTEILFDLYSGNCLYNIETGTYLWCDNKLGSIGCVHFSMDDAIELARDCYAKGLRWHKGLGEGDDYKDDKLFEFLKTLPMGNWVRIEEFERAVLEEDKKKLHITCKKGIMLDDVASHPVKITSMLGITEKLTAEEVYCRLYSDNVSLEDFEKIYRFLDKKNDIGLPYYDSVEDAKADFDDSTVFLKVLIGIENKHVMLVKNDGELTDTLWNELSSAVLSFDKLLGYDFETIDIASELRDRVVDWFEIVSGYEIVSVFEIY